MKGQRERKTINDWEQKFKKRKATMNIKTEAKKAKWKKWWKEKIIMKGNWLKDGGQ